MRPNKLKRRLYRKVNTKTWNVHHSFGGKFKHTRNSKTETRELVKGSMHGKKNRGLDYTPLFKFLLSKVGENWNQVYSEAKSRLDRTDPIYWMVALKQEEKKDFVRLGESSYYSGLYVDDDLKLQLSNPNLKPSDLKPFCSCCTHTLNGIPFGDDTK